MSKSKDALSSKSVEEPEKLKSISALGRSVNRVTRALREGGIQLPDDTKRLASEEARKLYAEIKEKNMKPNEITAFIDSKIEKLKVQSRIGEIGERIAGSAETAIGVEDGENSGKEKLSGNEVIVCVAILATVVALAYLSPAWAPVAVATLLAILAGMVGVKISKVILGKLLAQ